MRNELFIGVGNDWYLIDTIDGLDIKITKAIYNIENPSQRNSDFTKTVNIPGSKANDAVFQALFDVNFSIRNDAQLNPDFNPAKKAKCVYYCDGMRQIDGYCQLTDIVILNKDKVVYKIVIQGSNQDLYSRITNKTLNDLNLGTFQWDDVDIKSNWATGIPTGVMVYPMLDRGKTFDTRGGVYIGLGFDYESFKPWARIKSIFDQIISEAGYEYDSTFCNSELFKRLIMSTDNTRFVLDQDAIDALAVEADKNSSQLTTLVANASVGNNSLIWAKQIIYNNEITDPAAQFDPSTGTFTADNDGYYNFTAQLAGRITVTNTLPFSDNLIITHKIIRKRGSSYTVLGSKDIQTTTAIGVSIGDFVDYGTATTNGNIFINASNIALKLGDEVRVCISHVRRLLGGTIINNSVSVNPYPSSGYNNTFNEYINGQITYNTSTDVSTVLHPMKQTDFLMGIVKMFNLYIEQQQNGRLLIEPRDDFFLSATVDWTTKLDRSKDFVIKPQGLLTVKQINFNYQENGDDYSQLFKASTGYIHGYERKIFDNDFVKDVKNVDIPFTLIPLDDWNDRIMMRTTFQGIGSENTVKPIIAFYRWIDAVGANWNYYDFGSNTPINYTYYPYAGHLDDIQAPENDLCFSIQPLHFFVTPGQPRLKLTNQTLYNKYHYRQWSEIGDKNSKLVEAYFNLNAHDISQFSFRNIYWVYDAAYRVLEIQDYDPNASQTTKVLLLKLNNVSGITPADVNAGSGFGGEEVGGGEAQKLDTQNPIGDISRGTYVSGNGNFTGKLTKALIVGNDNEVGELCNNIFIRGNNNVVLPGLTNVTILDSDNNTVTESDKLIIGDSVTSYTVTGGSGLKTITVGVNTLAETQDVLVSLIEDLTLKQII